MSKVIAQIKQEHRNMDRVLRSLLNSVERLRVDTRDTREIELIHAMLYYIRVFPDRQHHPKEEDYLFKALRERVPETRALIEALEEEHTLGATLLENIYKALVAFERDGEANLKTLKERVSQYVELEWRHMRREEEELLPLAESKLTKDQWFYINDAFQRNVDPLFQDDISVGFRMLYDRIVRNSPQAAGKG